MKLQFLFVAAALCACRSYESKESDAEWRESHAAEASASSHDSAAMSHVEKPAMHERGTLTKDDYDFITGAMQGGGFEVESSRIALDKEVSDETREFARMMVEDHTQAGQKLAALVENKQGEMPEQALSETQQRQLDELRSLDGAAFDSRYHECQVEAHDHAIKVFERAGRMCDDADLRNFALTTLPTLREHRRRLDQQPK